MTATLMGRHSLDHVSDGLVTAFVGDLTPDMPTTVLPIMDAATEVLPAVDDEPTERFYISWFDAGNALVDRISEPKPKSQAGAEPSDADQERIAANNAVRASATPTFCLMLKIVRGLRNL